MINEKEIEIIKTYQNHNKDYYLYTKHKNQIHPLFLGNFRVRLYKTFNYNDRIGYVLNVLPWHIDLFNKKPSIQIYVYNLNNIELKWFEEYDYLNVYAPFYISQLEASHIELVAPIGLHFKPITSKKYFETGIPHDYIHNISYKFSNIFEPNSLYNNNVYKGTNQENSKLKLCNDTLIENVINNQNSSYLFKVRNDDLNDIKELEDSKIPLFDHDINLAISNINFKSLSDGKSSQIIKPYSKNLKLRDYFTNRPKIYVNFNGEFQKTNMIFIAPGIQKSGLKHNHDWIRLTNEALFDLYKTQDIKYFYRYTYYPEIINYEAVPKGNRKKVDLFREVDINTHRYKNKDMYYEDGTLSDYSFDEIYKSSVYYQNSLRSSDSYDDKSNNYII